MYQVTALYDDAEIGYGEGESRADAINEAIDSIGFYRGQPNVTIEVRNGARKSSMSLRKAEDIVAASGLF